MGIKYLSAMPWYVDDEVKIYRFCESGHMSLDTGAHVDLIVRLRKSLTKKTYGEVLSLYLEHVISIGLEPDNRNVFEETFQIIVFGPSHLAMIEALKKEATRLLSTLDDIY